MDIIGKRKWYFVISAMLIIPGLIAIGISFSRWGTPFRLSIDFTSGSLLEVQFQEKVQPGQVRAIVEGLGVVDPTVQTVGDGRTVVIRSRPIEAETKTAIEAGLEQELGALTERRFETVGPSVGREVTQAAALATIAASLAILGFIVFAWRKVPNSMRYGVCATVATLHDILVTLGFFSIMSLVLGWEADALFLTALLTVVGFSVQDTIVVFDRIRENVPKRRGEPYELIVNRSLLETLHRSLATQLNAIFIIIAILFFGGATIKQFVAVLLVGMLSGSYSSIFNAVPLLVVWEKGELTNIFRGPRRQPATQ
ncbi:MAG TPA: protein translocase subunit SecF [Anaerolineae bacterium]|nr:protein translocase subunit SecF [Anaerolineae bacterium]HOQ98743.1 protein translocase subunit SecF [Anaerolineae bacterium]HPL28326.1 protein translocase subunit SecF [Anaerolineae bacterium]